MLLGVELVLRANSDVRSTYKASHYDYCVVGKVSNERNSLFDYRELVFEYERVNLTWLTPENNSEANSKSGAEPVL